MRRFGLVILSLVLGLVSGCAQAPASPEAAREVAIAFMEARSQGNANRLYSLLTSNAQAAMDRATVAAFLRGEQVQFDGVGTPTPRDTGWIQTPIRGVTIASEERRVRWPEVQLTLQYDSGHWRVAWVDPLLARSLLAYGRSAFVEQLDLSHAIANVDPYHYRGPLEQHFAYRGLRRYREAEWYLLRAREVAAPVQQPDVLDALARFKLALGNPDEAAHYARSALELAGPFTPDTYTPRWRADTLVVLARSLLATGDRKGLETTLEQAESLDPQNAGLAVLRLELSTPEPVPRPTVKSTAPISPAIGTKPGR